MFRLAAVLIWLAAPGVAAECRLALLLALDVSSSVDAGEDRLQRQGLANALRAPGVQAAILSQPDRPVALSVYEWSGRYQQHVFLDWRLLHGAAELDQAAAAIAASRRAHQGFPTALGYSVGFAAGHFAKAPECDAQTLDISGDGLNNEGFGPGSAYRAFPLKHVTVNGLTIGTDPQVIDFYQNQVIKGPGAFVEIATDFANFEAAMTRKLIREAGSFALSQEIADR